MGQQAQEGQLGFVTQTAAGTYDDPGGAASGTEPHAGHFMKIRGGSMGGNRELIIPDPEIGGNRDIPDAVLGPIAYSGDFESYMRFDAIGPILAGGFGTVSSTPTGTSAGFDDTAMGSHVITPVDDVSAVPYLSVEEAVGASWEVFNYTDVRVNTIHMESDPDGYVMFDFGLLGITATANETRTADAVFDNSPLSVGSNVTVSWGGTEVCAKDFSFDLDNGIEDDDFCLGSNTLQALTPKRRSMTSSFSVRDDDASDFWQDAVFGGVGNGPVAGTSVKKALSIVIESGTDLLPPTTPTTKYSLTLTFPSASLLPAEVNPSGDDVIQNSYDIQVFRPDPSVAAVTATLVNRYVAIL